MKKFLGLIAGVLLAGPMVAKADPTNYMFVSPDFSIVQAGVPAGVTHITALFTVDLQPNLQNRFVLPSSWSISDGVTTITNLNASPNYSLSAYFWTDALGQISIMNFGLVRTTPYPVGTTVASIAVFVQSA